jgi:transposase
MFLKKHPRFKDGKDHVYYSPCETVRTELGPRQRKVCYLGELNSDGERAWRKVIEVVDAKGETRQLSLFPEGVRLPPEKDVVSVRLSGIRWERPRDFGDVYAAWSLWQRLGLDEFYRRQLDEAEDTADVPWSLAAALLTINRLRAPRSELFIDEKWHRQTALDDVLGVPDEKVTKDRLYRCLDLLIENKDAVEKHLKAKWGELFGASYDILLYDLTSTYFEGAAEGNPQAKRGHSRDHRPDCKPVIIALIVSEEGFPFAFEVLDGNRRDATTLADMLDVIDNKYGYARRIWVFDRGVASEDNLKILRARKTPCVAGTPRSMLKAYEKELTSSDWKKVKDEVEIHHVPRVSGEETFILVRSVGRRKKEKAMRELAMKRLEAGFATLAKSVSAGRLKDDKKIHVRIGQLLGRYPSVARLYAAELREENGARVFRWNVRQDRLHLRQITEGAYLLRTNLKDMELAKLWDIYMQLTEAEAAFRAIKSELMVRPIWHHKEKRAQAHILVAFLGYALWVTLKHSLKGSSFLHEYDYDVSPWEALQRLSKIKSGDIILPTTDGRTLRLRRVCDPDQDSRNVLEKLKIPLPGLIWAGEQM